MDEHSRIPGAESMRAPAEVPGVEDATRPLPDAEHFAASSKLPPLSALTDTARQMPLPAPTQAIAPQRPRRRWYHRLGRVGLFLLKWVVALVLALAILAGGLVGYLTVTEYRPAYAEKADSGVTRVTRSYAGGSLRILTFNTGYGALGAEADFLLDGGSSVNPDSEELVVKNMLGIEEILRAADADVLLLQEVDIDSDRSFGRNQWKQYEFDLSGYETRFALNYSCEYVPYPFSDRIGAVQSGLATFSRYDIRSATRYSLPNGFAWPERVANLKRCLLVTRLPIEGSEQELVLVNLHLEAYDSGEAKQAQTEALLALLEEEYAKGNYVVAGGDFNQLFPGTDRRYPLLETSNWEPGALERLTGDWAFAYDDSNPTCRLLNQPYDRRSALTQYYVIDGFIVSPNVTVTQVRTLNEDFAYSDHNPVLLEITLEAAE